MRKVQLLYFDGCPSHDAFLPRPQELLAQAHVQVPVEQRRVESAAAAHSERFLGSPTLRVNGVDIDPGAGERTDYGRSAACTRPSKDCPMSGCSTPCSRPAARGLTPRAHVRARAHGGRPGRAKTAVLEALIDAPCAEDVRHATVEVEALTSAHPPLNDQQWPAPVKAICGQYRRFGYELLLVTAPSPSSTSSSPPRRG